jgi:ribose-phosphate pyrophosphokinase
VDHLYGSTIFIPYIKSLNLDNLVIATPDVGGSKRANTYAKFLDVPMVLCHKTRECANVVSEMRIIGDVEGKNVIVIDDMIDTAGTITKAADLMIEQGALSVRAIASHCVMSGQATERVENSKLTELIMTDSIPYDKCCSKLKVLSIADMFADTIERVYDHRSISSQYLI